MRFGSLVARWSLEWIRSATLSFYHLLILQFAHLFTCFADFYLFIKFISFLYWSIFGGFIQFHRFVLSIVPSISFFRPSGSHIFSVLTVYCHLMRFCGDNALCYYRFLCINNSPFFFLYGNETAQCSCESLATPPFNTARLCDSQTIALPCRP